MSTITRIKGTVINSELPILTENGLITDTCEKYFYKVEKNGFVFTDNEKSAITTFYNTLKSNELLEYIDTFYPLFGENAQEIGIPLLGNKTLPFGQYNNIVKNNNNRVIGIKNIPKMDIYLGDIIQSLDNGFTWSFSLNGYFSPLNNFNRSNIIYFYVNDENGKYQVFSYINKMQSNDYEFYNAYTTNDSSNDVAILYSHNNMSSLENIKTNYYFIFGQGSHKSNFEYTRVVRVNDDYYANHSGNDLSDKSKLYNNFNGDISKMQLQSGREIDGDNSITTLTFFNNILNSTQNDIYLSALRQLCLDLGKDRGNNDDPVVDDEA